MKSQKTGLLVASIVFMLAGLAHVARLVHPFQVQLGSHLMGRRWSLAAAVVAILLSVWMGKLACCDKKAPETIPPTKV
jgi:hypothetical protein